MIVVTAAESRRIDQLTIEGGTAGDVLMERAGAGATAVLHAQFPHARHGRVIVCAGRGNNGGDGFVIARLLRAKRVRAEVALFGSADAVKGDAARALARLQRKRIPVRCVTSAQDLARLQGELAGATLCVDALLGTGLNAPVTGLLADAIHLMNSSGLPVFAVDIPSGINADTGLPMGVAVQAEATATFGFAKIGHVVHPGLEHTGALAVVDIGLARAAVEAVNPQFQLLDEPRVAQLVPTRPPDAHKGTAGHVLVIAGSRGHSGAALLAAHATCRTGAGLTTLAGPASLNDVLASGNPETMTVRLRDRNGRLEFHEDEIRRVLEGKTAVVVGPGVGTHDDAQRLVRFLVQAIDLPMLVDADALTCVARDPAMLKAARGRLVLTPHPGEMARLLDTSTATVQSDRVATARTFATNHRCVLVLKGARTVIAAPDGRLWINPTGNPGMASGGMGDALSGIVGALLAQRVVPADAACLGVYVHGAAGDAAAQSVGPIGLLASDVINRIPAELGRLSRAATAFTRRSSQ